MRREEQPSDFDWLTILLCLSLMAVGWLMIYSAEYNVAEPLSILNLKTSSGKQFIFIIIALVMGLLSFVLDNKFYRAFAYGFYGLGIFGLLLVLAFAREINGAKAWLDLGFFNFQGAEFAKVTTALALAGFLGGYNVNVHDRKTQMKAIGLVLLPMIIIVLQKDDGSMLVYTSFLIVLFRAGFPALGYVLGASLATLSILALMFQAYPILLGLELLGVALLLYNMELRQMWWFIYLGFVLLCILGMMQEWYIPTLIVGALALIGLTVGNWRKKWQLGLLVVGGVLIATAYTLSISYVFYKVLKPHQQTRIMVWLRPDIVREKHPDALYNVQQSMDAIRIGGLTGRGYLAGQNTKLGWVPESNTDFIFCTVGEEQGFLGAALVLTLYLILLLRIVYIAERQRSGFSRFYAYGVAGILFTHVFVNIGMTIGLMPVIGIPLPFMSYGGSSLISFVLMIAILIKLDSNRLLVFR